MVALVDKWEYEPDSFEEASKRTFDELVMAKMFVEGPLASKPSKFTREFGPYDPNCRWAFGKHTDGRYLKTNLNKQE